MTACRICGNEQGNRTHVVREMMYGTRDTFEYIECAGCGCLQIAAYPTNLDRYYPSEYWDFESRRMDSTNRKVGLDAWIRQRRTRYWLNNKPDPFGKMLALGNSIPRHITWLRRAGVSNLDISVLDIGCGIGDRLHALRSAGLTHLEGVDPFIEGDIRYPNGVQIYKKSLFDVDGTYDFITLHHSFEHMPDPLRVMRMLYELVAPSGVALLRIPVAAQAWRDYGVHWVQIDAPRHFYLHTVESLRLVAKQAGFHIERIDFDSDAFQFWGSEQYRQDIPLYDPRSCEFGIARSIFNPEAIQDYARKSRELNKLGKGDQACFYLRRL